MNNFGDFEKFMEAMDKKREISGCEIVAIASVAYDAAVNTFVDGNTNNNMKHGIKAGVLHVFGDDDIFNALRKQVKKERNSKAVENVIAILRMLSESEEDDDVDG